MAFPESPRVIYASNPLASVVCQFRFPAILRIESEPAARFQEAIAEYFPILQDNDAQSVIPQGGSLGLSVQFTPVGYHFRSEDGNWVLSLTKDALSIITTSYLRWEDFESKVRVPLAALTDIYKPAYFSRIGLRYVDVIVRSKVGLDGIRWSELLHPQIAGILQDDAFLEIITGDFSQSLFNQVSTDTKTLLQHGLSKNGDSDEECYTIDSDFFREGRLSSDEYIPVLDSFRRQAGSLFRWCITDKLHTALGPVPVETPK